MTVVGSSSTSPALLDSSACFLGVLDANGDANERNSNIDRRFGVPISVDITGKKQEN
jgi:hypothetical protein